MTNSTDETLAFIRVYIVARYFYIFVFVVGLIGNTFNLLVFFQKKFRSNSCSIYFIAYSINNFVNLTVGLFLWSLTLGFQLPLENHSLKFCKIRRYMTHVNYLLSSCLLTMASINRYARVRQAQFTKYRHHYIFFCERRTTFSLVGLTIAFCIFANLHIPFLFEIYQGECYARAGLYRILFDVFFLIFYGLCPPVIMIVVNIATVAQIRCVRRFIQPTVSRREYNLIGLVIAHSIFNAVLNLPFTINKFVYYTFEGTSPTEIAKLVNVVTLLIAFMNPGFSFFLYTFTTKSFRDEFVRVLKIGINAKCLCFCRQHSEIDITTRRETTTSAHSLPFTYWKRTRREN